MKRNDILSILLGILLIFSPLLFDAGIGEFLSGVFIICFSVITPISFLSLPVGFWLLLKPLIFHSSPLIYVHDTWIGAAILFLFFVPDLASTIGIKRAFSAIFALLAFCSARYMAAFQLGHIASIFDPLFGKGTELVITSFISKSFPISDAGLGAIFYLVEAIFSFAGDEKRYRTSPWIVLVFGLMASSTTLVGIILLFLQLFVLKVLCFWCLFAAIMAVAIFCLSWGEFRECLTWIQILKNKKIALRNILKGDF
jgi:uncharacterized membrane protein